MIAPMTESMFHLHLPIVEKILRPVIVYVCLILFLRLFGKRELAQLNPFDLVVLLCLANTVQNGIIGDDNTVSGGIIGAFSLLAINWLLMRFLYSFPRVNAALEGTATTLIQKGVIDQGALKSQTMTEVELLSVLHKQGLDDVGDVERCVLEPNGTFFVEPVKPSSDDLDRVKMLQALQALTAEVQQLRAQLSDAARTVSIER